MEGLFKLIFWIVIGLIWFISALARKSRERTMPVQKRSISEEPSPGEAFEAPEDELARFLKMVSGKQEVAPAEKPVIVEEAKPVRIEPEPQRPPIVPAALEIEKIEEAVEEPEPMAIELEELEVIEEVVVEEPKAVGIEPEKEEKAPISEGPLKIEREVSFRAIGRLSISELKRGIVLSEILGAPRATRPFSYPRD